MQGLQPWGGCFPVPLRSVLIVRRVTLIIVLIISPLADPAVWVVHKAVKGSLRLTRISRIDILKFGNSPIGKVVSTVVHSIVVIIFHCGYD